MCAHMDAKTKGIAMCCFKELRDSAKLCVGMDDVIAWCIVAMDFFVQTCIRSLTAASITRVVLGIDQGDCAIHPLEAPSGHVTHQLFLKGNVSGIRKECTSHIR